MSDYFEWLDTPAGKNASRKFISPDALHSEWQKQVIEELVMDRDSQAVKNFEQAKRIAEYKATLQRVRDEIIIQTVVLYVRARNLRTAGNLGGMDIIADDLESAAKSLRQALENSDV